MVVVQTDVLRVTILAAAAGGVGATGRSSDTLVVVAVVSRVAVVVDGAGRCTRDDADIV